MLKLLLLTGLVCSCSGMSMSAKSSKTMTMTSPDGAKKMFVAHASKSDLDGSASGYIYQSDGKNPAMIVHLGESHYVEPHDFAQFVNHGYETFLHPVKVEPIKFEHFGDFGGKHHFGEGFEGGKHHFGEGYESGKLHFGEGYEGGKHHFGEGFEGGKHHFGEGFEGGKLHFGGLKHHFGGEGGGDLKKFVEEKGSEDKEEFYHDGGEKGGKGYKDFEEFNEDLLKKLIKDHESGFKKEAGGEKKKHFEEGEKFEDHKEEKKGEEGENFNSKKSHKKGHKTTGFHNVYHKDEFKKQHSFYDEADDGGHHDKFGKHYAAHGAAGGGHKKGGHLNSAHHEGEFLKKNDFEKGNIESAAKGFHGAEGGNSHYANNAEFGHKGGKHFHKGFGFGGHGGYGFEH